MRGPVRAKKHLGQHFLRNEDIATAIVDALPNPDETTIIEVGPGDGVLTKYLFDRYEDVQLFDIDIESVRHLKQVFPTKVDQIKLQDFLSYEPEGQVSVIGNFPYNISSQIVFHILEHRGSVSSMVGMFQKEVAERIASKKGSKVYGILSVLSQAIYDVEYLFTVGPQNFDPPPKVDSGVIRFERKQNLKLDCDERAFFSVVKQAFNQRRKMIRKSLRDRIPEDLPEDLHPYLTMRPEQLDYTDFVRLVAAIAPSK